MFICSSHTRFMSCFAFFAVFLSISIGIKPNFSRDTTGDSLLFDLGKSKTPRSVASIKHVAQKPAFLRTQATKLHGSGNTYDLCEHGDRCNGVRKCTVSTGGKKCPKDSLFFCFCLPDVLTECTFSSECDKGEVCAEDKTDLRPSCVSKDAVKLISYFRLNVPPPVPGDGLSYSRCEKDSQCSGDRFCSFRGNKNFVPCRGRSPCYCHPKNITETVCLAQSQCEKGDVCANTADYGIPVCVSKKAEQDLFSVTAVPNMKGGGLSFDPCQKDKDCLGGRVCTRTIEGDGKPCKQGDRACICLPTPVSGCQNLGDCIEEEVCAETPFFEGPVCASQFSRRAFRFKQVIFPGVCPVLIPNDPPQGVRQTVLGSNDDSAQTTSTKIVGGGLVSPELAPYLVAIRDNKKVYYCSGTLISKRYVITAAHCATAPKDFVAVFAKKGTRGGEDIRVKRVFHHPKFNNSDPDLYYDISILELAKDVPSGTKFMKLNKEAQIPKDGSPIRAAGYGGQDEKGKSNDYRLRQVDMYTVPNEQCAKTYKEKPFVVSTVSKELQLCVGVPRGGCDTCQGDSGGPVLQYQRGEPIHLGITSYGEGCGRPDYEGVYTRTSAFLKWIRESTPAVFETN